MSDSMTDDKVVHIYDDDIQEADNDLPRWWLGIFYGSMIFAAIYWVAYEVLKFMPEPIDSYRIERAEAARAEEARLKAEGPLTDEKLLAYVKDDAMLAAGKITFIQTCASCHGQNAGGMVGPNLTDKFWIHGGKPVQIIETVRKGWPEKGMPTWGPMLGEKKIREVTAYVLSIRNTNVAGGKTPQGDPEGS
jgi:cytochrome c oxidase cbb3-type subunit 3